MHLWSFSIDEMLYVSFLDKNFTEEKLEASLLSEFEQASQVDHVCYVNWRSPI